MFASRVFAGSGGRPGRHQSGAAAPGKNQRGTTNRLLSVVGGALLIGCLGCGGKTLSSVTGTVTHQGKPVSGATVTFRSEQLGKMATAITDAQGRFTLTTHLEGKGAAPGQYQVTVTKFSTVGGAGGVPPAASMEAMVKQARDKTGGPKNELPGKYADAGTSGLSFTVAASGKNDFPIELRD